MAADDFRVEKASEADIPALIGLLGLLFEQEKDFSADPEKQGRGLLMIISDPSAGTVLVLRRSSDGMIAGTVSLLFTVSTATGGKAAVVEDLILLPEFRGRGLGSLLIKGAFNLAFECGVLRLSLLTDHSNTEALSFYRKNGFIQSGMIVMRKLIIES